LSRKYAGYKRYPDYDITFYVKMATRMIPQAVWTGCHLFLLKQYFLKDLQCVYNTQDSIALPMINDKMPNSR
jgi:hypothetical protein